MTRRPGVAKPGWPTAAGLVVILGGGLYLCTVPAAPSSTSPPAFLPATTTAPVAPVPPRYVPASVSEPGEHVSAPAAEESGDAGLVPRVDLDGGDDDDHHHRRDDDRDEYRHDNGREDDNFGRNHHHLLTND